MRAKPITENCRRRFEARAHACFGISPFNSYFSEERIQHLAEWGRKEFHSISFFVPDVPSAFTLEALGYTPDKAAWKARRQCQYLLNKIGRGLRNAGISDSEACAMVLNWEALSTNSQYLALHDEVTAVFEGDPVFRAACIEASRWVLEKRVDSPDGPTQEMLQSAVRYLLAEIPLFLDTAAIVQRDCAVFCYHQCIEFLEHLYSGRYAISPSLKQGFLVLEPETIHATAALMEDRPNSSDLEQ